jgi:hypothetical protein
LFQTFQVISGSGLPIAGIQTQSFNDNNCINLTLGEEIFTVISREASNVNNAGAGKVLEIFNIALLMLARHLMKYTSQNTQRHKRHSYSDTHKS